MDIVVWLRSLGLEQYEATFRDNAINDSVLPDLTCQTQTSHLIVFAKRTCQALWLRVNESGL
jgi:SAM domain (Sterile alpha motif)